MGISAKKSPKRKKPLSPADKARATRLAKARARSREERELRLAKVLKLRFVQSWTNAEIAKKLEMSERTIERDVNYLRARLRKKMSGAALENEMRDIAETLKLRHEETIKLLWNDYLQIESRIEKAEKDLKILISELKGDITGKDRVEVIKSISNLRRVIAGMISQGQRLLAQITETDDSFVEQLRKLGLVHGEIDADPEDGSLLLEIRTRRANIESIRAKNSEAEAKAKETAGVKN